MCFKTMFPGDNIDVDRGNVRRSRAYGVNNDGRIVGWIQGRDGKQFAFSSFMTPESMVDLNSISEPPTPRYISSFAPQPKWDLQEARSINERYVVVGNGRLNGVRRGFMLIPQGPMPVPPPRPPQPPGPKNGSKARPARGKK